VIGGLQPFCDRLVQEIGAEHVMLRQPVVRIEQSSKGVKCVTIAGITYTGDRVIVTAPPSVCDDITFVPALPVDRVALHKHYRAGEVIKVCCVCAVFFVFNFSQFSLQ
jgi:monoamine oxidase